MTSPIANGTTSCASVGSSFVAATEIADDTVVRLAGERTILKSSLTRSQLGYDLNLDGTIPSISPSKVTAFAAIPILVSGSWTKRSH
jgi:hypothetical protein